MDVFRRRWAVAFPGLIMAIVSLPFFLLGWLLVDGVLAEIQRQQRVEQALQLFDTGLALLPEVEFERDFGVVRFYDRSHPLMTSLASSRSNIDETLPDFIFILGERGSLLSADQISALVAARQGLDKTPLNSGFLASRQKAQVLIERLYEALFSELYIADLMVGDPVSANQLLLIMGERLRSAREHSGMLTTLALQATLNSGYLASEDAGRFDLAWGGLHDDLLALERQLRLVEQRGADSQRMQAMQLQVAAAWRYLELMAEQVLVSDRVEMNAEAIIDSGTEAMQALQTLAEGLFGYAGQVVEQAGIGALRYQVMLLLGLLVLYLLLIGFALMLYRSRYEVLKVQTENRTKSQFLARMSHEIRTPLNGVIGLAELLRETDPTPRQQQYIELIESSGKSLVGLVNDVLDHARIEAGKLELEAIPFSLQELVGESCHIFSLRAQDNGTLIFWALAPQVPETLIGDPSRLRQVLVNLLSNAVKFTEHGLIEVIVSLVSQRAEHCRLRFEVKDSGIGLTPQEQEHLFELFAQASPEVSRRYGGSGLGLSISRELVRLMDGDIGVRSARNWGSTFFFEISLGLAEDMPSLAASAPTLQPSLLLDPDGQLSALVQGRRAFAEVQVVKSVGACLDLLRARPAISRMVIYRQQVDDTLRSWLSALQPVSSGRVVQLLIGVRGGADKAFCDAYGVDTVLASNVLDESALYGLFADIAPAPASTTSATASELPSYPGLRVLVAEDNMVNQTVINGMLTRLGVAAQMTADGREVLDCYQQRHGAFDLLLMDIDMPVMDGLAASREIRALERRMGWPRCPIVALSAHVLPEYRQAALSAGMDEQLGKPIKLEQLAKLLEQVASRAELDGV